MKKTLVILALAFALMLALGATPAHAKYAGFSSSTQFVDWTTAASLASQNADATLQTFGPHKGYATTTIKCAVCHSVHRGENKILSGGYGCAYCHTTSYYGGAAFANTISWKVTSGGGPHSSCASSYCHGGPHGVGASAYAGPATRLLVAAADSKLDTLNAANTEDPADLSTWSAQTRVLATGAVCGRSGCHTNSMFGVTDDVSAEDTVTIGAGSVSVHGHRVIAAATTNWNADNRFSDVTSKTNFQIAWKPVTYCNSCHDLTDDNNGGEAAFPHAITDVVSTAQSKDGTFRSAVWLTAGADAGAQTTAVGAYNDYTGSTSTTSAAGSSILDGTCLKCHRTSTLGVGLTF